MTFRMTMLPARDGDCILLTWGRGASLHHMLVDLGREGTYRAIKADLQALENIELFVTTHVDADHIAGAIPLVREDEAPFTPKEAWHNSRPQLEAAANRAAALEPFGAEQGEKLARGIVKFGWPWNTTFGSKVVSTGSPEGQATIRLAGGLKITLLSPTDQRLAALIPQWDRELEKAGISSFDPDVHEDPLGPEFEPFGLLDVEELADEDYDADDTKANGASIAFIAEFEGRRVLLGADAHSEVLEAALAPLAEAEGGRYRIDLLKVSHHGSKANTSKAFPALIDCTRFAISTDGSRHRHPDRQTVARLLTADPDRPKQFFFNYRQDSSEVWDSRALMRDWNYEVIMPADGENGTLVIDLLAD